MKVRQSLSVTSELGGPNDLATFNGRGANDTLPRSLLVSLSHCLPLSFSLSLSLSVSPSLLSLSVSLSPSLSLRLPLSLSLSVSLSLSLLLSLCLPLLYSPSLCVSLSV